jgi:hypothetical protein
MSEGTTKGGPGKNKQNDPAPRGRAAHYAKKRKDAKKSKKK